jgi:xanthine/CO dehydrogenase XdhC/CoxF family maturation factor
MLVTAEGELTGAISGGCLEGDARRRARQAILRGQSTLVTYDSTDPDDDLNQGAQLGCRGIIQILLEPLDFADRTNPVELLRIADSQTRPAVLVTAFHVLGATQVRLNGRLLLTADGAVQGELRPDALVARDELLNAAAQVLEQGVSATQNRPTEEGSLRVFLEWVRPPVRLTVYGAGNDVQPLVRFAAALGWRVRVLDGRPALVTAARFPEAESVAVLPLTEVPTQLASQEFVLLMTHNYPYELAVMRHLLSAPPLYIGLLGPRKKAEQMLADLRAEGYETEGLIDGCLHSPVGLSIGAETPEEIAVSIVAEMQAVLTRREGGFLRDAPGPIHVRQAAVLQVQQESPAI